MFYFILYGRFFGGFASFVIQKQFLLFSLAQEPIVMARIVFVDNQTDKRLKFKTLTRQDKVS